MHIATNNLLLLLTMIISRQIGDGENGEMSRIWLQSSETTVRYSVWKRNSQKYHYSSV
jgi:hypothetical protein